MIQVFLFDYDGVITAGVKDGIPAARLAKNLGVSHDEASDLILSIWAPYSTGKMTDTEAWKSIEKHYGRPISSEQRQIWYTWEELEPLPEMIELVRQVRAKGFKAGLLSNVLPVTAQLIREHGGYNEFDFLVLSCEAGARKPDLKVYESALANLPGVAPEEVVFLDDREPCVAGAENIGMKTIHVTDHAKAIVEVLHIIETA